MSQKNFNAMNKKIIFASDYRGIELRLKLVDYARQLGLNVQDIGIEEGSPLDYVDITKQLLSQLYNSDAIGVLICGSGQGITMAANRSSNIRAALCRTPEDSKSSREKLNANVLCLGSKYSSLIEATECLDAFINTSFNADKHGMSASKLNTNATAHAVNGVNLIVRAIITHEDHILLTTATASNKEFASNLYFLPGGHVDYKEPAIDALKRELKEEMNVEAGSVEFKGALECSWNRKGSVYHELDLVYQVEIPGLSLANPPQPTEPFHTFVWMPISSLPNLKILPETLQPLLSEATSPSGKVGFYSQMLKEEDKIVDLVK